MDHPCEKGVIETCWSEIYWSDEVMAQKRQHFEVSEMEEENAMIHGVVVEVLAVRPSRKTTRI